jgi:hypothetical protein
MIMQLRDAYIADIPMGSLMYPSAHARDSCKGGNYYLEDLMKFVDDSDIFPAIVIPGQYNTFVQILTPTGIHAMSKFSMVAYEKS